MWSNGVKGVSSSLSLVSFSDSDDINNNSDPNSNEKHPKPLVMVEKKKKKDEDEEFSSSPTTDRAVAATTVVTSTTHTTTMIHKKEEEPEKDRIWTRSELESFAQSQGVVLSWTTLGPSFRVMARAQHNPNLVLGYLEGWLRPRGVGHRRLDSLEKEKASSSSSSSSSWWILHLDRIQVSSTRIAQARQENPNGFRTNGAGGQFFGIALLLAYRACVEQYKDNSQSLSPSPPPPPVVVELLAIQDSVEQHDRLVKLYRLAGFTVVKYVGDELLRDISDRLIWGGIGTLMRHENLPQLLRQWTRRFESTLDTTTTTTTRRTNETTEDNTAITAVVPTPSK